jgi:hypothetical protein
MPDHTATAFCPSGDKFTNVVELAQVNGQRRQEAGAIFIGRTESLCGLELGLAIETDQGIKRKSLSRQSSAARPMLSPRRACRPRFIGPEPFATTCQGTPITDTDTAVPPGQTCSENTCCGATHRPIGPIDGTVISRRNRAIPFRFSRRRCFGSSKNMKSRLG